MTESMGEDSSNTVLRRKASETLQGQRSRSVSPARALGQALRKVASSLWSLRLSVGETGEVEVGPDDLANQIVSDGVLMLLEGADGSAGAAICDLAAMSAFIEHQTIGTVIDRAPHPRQATRVDAAMVQPLIDATLAALSETAGAEAALAWMTGFRFGAWMKDAATLGLALDAERYHCLRASVDFSGAKPGQVTVILPHREPVRASEPERATRGDLAGVVMGAPIELRAIMARLRLPLVQIEGLRPGQVLDIPGDALGQARLETVDGTKMSLVRLGQAGGFRALRLLEGTVAPAEPAAKTKPPPPQKPKRDRKPARARNAPQSTDPPQQVIDAHGEPVPGPGAQGQAPPPSSQPAEQVVAQPGAGGAGFMGDLPDLPETGPSPAPAPRAGGEDRPVDNPPLPPPT